MDADRWRRIEELCHAAAARAAGDRAAFLDEACRDDAELRREVESLLAGESRAEQFLQSAPGCAPVLVPGTRLGSHEILGLIGVGGMGVVYKAIDSRLKRPVAIKAIDEARTSEPRAIERLRREALAAASLHHPYICQVYELLEEEGRTYLVMEHVEGTTLAATLQRGPLSIDDTIHYTREVAEALGEAHRRGLVHRDVKPSNIIITPNGHLKVVDFGLARAVSASDAGDETTRMRLTEPGVFVGTPHYMSPEQALGQPLDARTDLFSLGVVMFECLTGKLPFAGETRYEYLQSLLSAEPRNVGDLRADVPKALQVLLARCLEKQVSQRVDSAARLSAELIRVTSAAEPTGLDRVWHRGVAGLTVSTRALAVGTIATVLLAVAAAGVWVASHGPIVRPQSAGAPSLEPVVTWPGIESDSRISPDGEWISFVSDAGGTTRIWLRKLQGEQPTAIVTPAGRILGHVWSPDGRQIAYLLREASKTFVQIVPAFFGGSLQTSVEIEVPVEPKPVAWIGTAIYLEAAPWLLRFDVGTHALEDLTVRWSMRPTSFDLRPDGLKVVFSAAQHGQEDLWIANLDGSEAVKLTDDAFVDRSAIWAGTQSIVYASDRGGQVDLWRLSLTDGSTWQLTTSAAREAPEAVSPDGSILTFQQTTEAADLWQIDPRTGAEQPLTSDGQGYFWPATAGGSRALAFQRVKPIHRGSVYRLLDTDVLLSALDGASLRAPSQRIGEGYGARLSPGATWLAFLQWSTETVGDTLLSVIDLGTGLVRQVADRFQNPGFTNGPPFDPAGVSMIWAHDRPDLYFVARLPSEAPEIRRFQARPSAGDTEVVVGGLRPKDVVLSLALSNDGTRLGYLVWAAGGTEVHVRQLASGVDRMIWTEKAAPRFRVHVKGWLRDDAGLLVLRSQQNSEGTYSVDILRVGTDGTVRTLGNAARAYPAGARLDAGSGTLYLTTVEGGMHNLSAFSVVGQRLRPATRNAFAGVTFSGMEVAPDGKLIYSRQETKHDVWMIRSHPDAASPR